MNVLVVGGSGRVASLILPFMKDHVRIRVFDLVPPADGHLEYVAGDVNDPQAVAQALAGMDGLIYMVMPPLSHYDDIRPNHDVNVKGLHVVLQSACEAGILHAVYASTGSVHDWRRASFANEDLPCDARDVYGFTKALGERVCEWFCRTRGMTLVALRLFWPRSRQDWLEARRQENPILAGATADSDVARAFLQALKCRASGFHPVFISGDYEGKVVNTAGARRLLDWEPLARPP